MADLHAPPAYYLEGDSGQPAPELVWCRQCGASEAKARGLRIWECWSGDDSPQWCAGCHRLVDTGTLSAYAIDAEFEAFLNLPPDEPCLETAQILTMMLASLRPDAPHRPQIEAWLAIATPSLEVPRG